MTNNLPIEASAPDAAARLQFSAPIELRAAEQEGQRPSFEMVAYTGAPVEVANFSYPVIVDLAGVRSATATIPVLFGHDHSRIIGQGEAKIDSSGIHVTGSVLSDDADGQKVTNLAKNGFRWQVSIGATPTRREFLAAGKTAVVNGREVTGPMIIARETSLYEVSFVAVGADKQTSAAVAASHSTEKGTNMDPKFKAWLEANEYDPSTLSAAQMKPLEAAWKAESKTSSPKALDDVIATARADEERKSQIAAITAQFIAENPNRDSDFIATIEALGRQAIDAKWDADKYELELMRSSRVKRIPSLRMPNSDRLTSKVVEAAICQAGRLAGHEDQFDDQTLQAAHDKFRGGIGLKQLFLLCAEANGYRASYANDINIQVQRAAFGMSSPNRIEAQGWSTLEISSILSNTANKFLMDGWNAVDMTPMRIAAVRSVRDFKSITTVSLTGALMFEELGAAGEIKHGTLGEQTYSNKVDTYAKMLAITRQDLINDDLGALTAVPRRLGRGAALKLNDIFWVVFLGAQNAGFFASGNNNFNEGVADVTLGGIEATETIFMSQTDYDGKPLGLRPAIVVVPTAKHASMLTLMNSETIIDGTATAKQGSANIWKGRFRVETSPYMHNTSYTGYSATAWYMLADPNDMAMIEIAALNGRVEPTVETADADFNVLGVQMRGYSDVGVALQEKKAAVKADGGAS